jgi:hypothetical protein
MRRRRSDLRAVDRDDTDLHQTGLRAQLEHPAEQVADRFLMPSTEARNRGVIGHPIRADHPERDVLATAPLDPTRRAHPDRIRGTRGGDIRDEEQMARQRSGYRGACDPGLPGIRRRLRSGQQQ